MKLAGPMFAAHIAALAITASLASAASKREDAFWAPFWIIIFLGILFHFLRGLYLTSPNRPTPLPETPKKEDPPKETRGIDL